MPDTSPIPNPFEPGAADIAAMHDGVEDLLRSAAGESPLTREIGATVTRRFRHDSNRSAFLRTHEDWDGAPPKKALDYAILIDRRKELSDLRNRGEISEADHVRLLIEANDAFNNPDQIKDTETEQ